MSVTIPQIPVTRDYPINLDVAELGNPSQPSAQIPSVNYGYRASLMSDLKAITGTLPDKLAVYLEGYNSVNDGGQGWFYFNSGSSATDNGGTVIQRTAGTGRFIRVPDGDITPYHFGAYGNGSNNDTTAVGAAIVACAGKSLYFPSGTFLVDTITISTSDVTLYGNKLATIKQRTNSNYRIFLITGDNVKFRGLRFDGNASSNTASNLGMVNYNDGGTGGEVDHCVFTSSGGDAIVFNNCGGFIASFNDISDVSRGVTANSQNVTAIDDAQVVFNKMYDFRAAGSNGVGIRIAATETARQTRTQIIGNQIEGTGIGQCVDIYQGAYDVVVSLNTFSHANWGLSLGHGINCSVTGNNCRGNVDYGIELADGCLQCTVTGNTVDGKNSAGTTTLVIGIAIQGGAPSGFTDSFDCTISGNKVKNGISNSLGIYLFYCERCNITGNDVDAMYKAVALQETNRIIVSSNALTNPTYGYIEVTNSAKTSTSLAITGNELAGASCTYGITLSCTNAFTISNTFIDGNTCSFVCSSGGLAINDLSKVLNTRIGDNHSSDPADTTKTINVGIWVTTGDYTVTDADEWIHCNASGGAINITLLDASTRIRKQWGIIKIDSSGNSVTVKTSGGSTVTTLSAQNKYAQVRSYGGGIIIIANN